MSQLAQQDVKPEAFTDLHREVAALGLVVRRIGAALAEYAGHAGSPDSASLATPSVAVHLGSVPDMALATFAQKVYLARRDREKACFSPELFNDPAWDILLDLFIAHAQDKFISVSDTGLAAQVPATTALRWVWSLEKTGLVERLADKNDKRRSFVMLTASGQSYTRRVLGTMSARMKPPLFSK